MATGSEWREYFEKKSLSYLRKQLTLVKQIKSASSKLDNKITFEFSHLDYMAYLASIINLVIVEKTRSNK